MSGSCPDHYTALHEACGEVVVASFQNDTSGLQAESHSFISDLQIWHDELISTRLEAPLVGSALSEYQFGLLAVVQGQYRQAFMALRLSLELLFGAALLSTNELDLRTWLRGERDLIWASLINADTGPLSKPFVRVFQEALADEATHYRRMAETVYRECSEHVHGNSKLVLQPRVIYQPDVYRDWHAKAKTIRLVVSFAFFVRYIELANSAVRSRLEPMLLENLGHLPPVRVLLGAPVEQENA